MTGWDCDWRDPFRINGFTLLPPTLLFILLLLVRDISLRSPSGLGLDDPTVGAAVMDGGGEGEGEGVLLQLLPRKKAEMGLWRMRSNRDRGVDGEGEGDGVAVDGDCEDVDVCLIWSECDGVTGWDGRKLEGSTADFG